MKITFNGKSPKIDETGYDFIVIKKCNKGVVIHLKDINGSEKIEQIDISNKNTYKISKLAYVYFESNKEVTIEYELKNLLV